MSDEPQMPIAVVQDYTDEQWFELWSLEAKTRNDLWKEWNKVRKELDELLAENKRLAEIKRLHEQLDACTIHSCGDHCQRPTCKRAMQNAIKDAYWQLLPFLKPGDEKTKAVLEQLQKFL